MEFEHYAIAAAVGTAYGALAGILKYLLIWRPLLFGRRAVDQKNFGVAQIISLVANVAILLSVFLLRHWWPYHFEVTILATALALSLTGRFTQLRDIKKMDALKKAPHDLSTTDGNGSN